MRKFNPAAYKIFRLCFFISTVLFLSCGENSVQNTDNGELILDQNGLIEDVGGDCSAVQVRTRSFGNFNVEDYSKLRFDFYGSSDADLSSISIFYYENNDIVYLVNLSNKDEINSTRSVEVNSPKGNREFFSRVTLKSSVCTGQVFYLTFRDLKIFAFRQ